MANVLDWFGKLPKWVSYTLSFIAVAGLCFLIALSFFPKKEVEPQREEVHIVQEMPDAEVDNSITGRLKSYINGVNDKVGADDYWNQLDGEDGEDSFGDGGLIVNGPNGSSSGDSRYNGEYLDPEEYSELEIYYIKNNLKSKAKIDAEHAQRKAEDERLRESLMASSQRSPAMTQAQKDSILRSRMEMAYEMAAKYSQPAQPAQQPVQQPVAEPEPELRHIDVSDHEANVEASYIDMNAFSDDGIISSLSEPTSGGVIHYNDVRAKSTPVKCTFLSTEKLVSGQRVIMRLMQDLVLSDGTLIPSNTHITGTCRTGNRLQITVNAIHYGGKMFQTNIIAYDNDGTEGIYCPVLETEKAKRSKKRVAGAAASGTASAVLGALTGNPYLTRIASSSMNEVTRAVEDNGSISINVVSGYVFYLLETPEDEK